MHRLAMLALIFVTACIGAAQTEQPIRVLDGKARVTLTAKLDESSAPGRTLPVRLLIQYQACDDARCLRPTERGRRVTAHTCGIEERLHHLPTKNRMPARR